MNLPAGWAESIKGVISQSPQLETWSGHFDLRLPELNEVLHYWPRERVKSALEIGCGNGLAAVYLSPLADRITATDLANPEHEKHAIGLNLAKIFVGEMKRNNVDVIGCGAENLPFDSDRFDLVYGIYCLEHIPNRSQALKEAHRVLKSGGEVLFTVPGSAWGVIYPMGFYYELFMRIFKRAKKLIFNNKPMSESIKPEGNVHSPIEMNKVKNWKTFHASYPHFPLPQPHGEHSSWIKEVLYYRKNNWKNLVIKNGFRDVEVIPISILPRIFFPFGLYERILPLNAFLSSLPFLSGIAQFYCIRAKK